MSVRKLFIIAVLTLVGIFLAGTRREAGASVMVVGGTINIEGVVTPVGPNFLYSYSIVNMTGTVTLTVAEQVFGFSLPFFDDQATSIVGGFITAPTLWSFEFVTATPGNWGYDPTTDPSADSYDAEASAFIAPPFVLRFFTDTAPVLPYETLPGFSFLSQFGSGNGPVVVELSYNIAMIDPPQPITPNSPIPEPSTMLLLGSGLAGLGFFRRRKKAA